MRIGVKWAALTLVLLGSCSAQPHLVTAVRVPSDGGPLYATIAGKEVKIAPAVANAWMLGGGRTVAYSTAQGAGGFENEGQALYLYNATNGKNAKILAEPFEITRVQEAKSASGKTALLVSMEDGGLGASHIALVDPSRGEVFREDGAVFAAVATGAIAVAWYSDDDWEKLQANAAVTPYKTRRYDLDELLSRNVIVRKP